MFARREAANRSAGAARDYGPDGWPWRDYRMRYSAEVTVLFCIAYAAVFLVGFVGNTSVVLVVYKNVRMRSSPTNIFIVNLAVADLLVIVVCVPFTLVGSITAGKQRLLPLPLPPAPAFCPGRQSSGVHGPFRKKKNSHPFH